MRPLDLESEDMGLSPAPPLAAYVIWGKFLNFLSL